MGELVALTALRLQDTGTIGLPCPYLTSGDHQCFSSCSLCLWGPRRTIGGRGVPHRVTLKLRNSFTDKHFCDLAHCLPVSHQEQDPHKGNKHRMNVPDICSWDTQGETSLVNTRQATWSSDPLCPEDRQGPMLGRTGLQAEGQWAGTQKGGILLPTWDTQSVTAPGLSLCGPSDPISKSPLCPFGQASSQHSRERTALSDAPAELPPQRRVRPWSGCLL